MKEFDYVDPTLTYVIAGGSWMRLDRGVLSPVEPSAVPEPVIVDRGGVRESDLASRRKVLGRLLAGPLSDVEEYIYGCYLSGSNPRLFEYERDGLAVRGTAWAFAHHCVDRYGLTPTIWLGRTNRLLIRLGHRVKEEAERRDLGDGDGTYVHGRFEEVAL